MEEIEGFGPATSIGDPGREHSVAPRRNVTRLILRRLALGLVTLFIVSILIFSATTVLPGDAARAVVGRTAPEEAVEAARRQLGLDRPVLVQYADWITNVLSGDLGTSFASGIPVTEVIGERLVNSLFLMILAAIIGIPLGVALGALSAWHRDSHFDHSMSFLTLGIVAVPDFVIAILLIILFATTVFHVLPALSLVAPGELPWDHPSGLVLPVTALVVVVMPYIIRITRASMAEILDSEYVEMARLKGMNESLVVWRHALPNALAPTLQVIALTLAYLTGGIVVIEYVFNYPGIGSAFVESVLARDVPVVQALALIIACFYVVVNAAADIGTVLVSGRLRTALNA